MRAALGNERLGPTLLVSCGLVALGSGAAGAQVTPHTVWTPEARSAPPVWVQLWIPFMFLVFGTGLLFVRKHPHAWWMVGTFLASHLASGIERSILGAECLTVGMIALNHSLFWTPAAVCFFLTTRIVRAPKSFRIWRSAVLATTAISLVFDYRDARSFLRGG
jgi:hypothetical protein